MDNQIFRKESLDQISSPEQLNDYLRVTNPAVWLVLTAVILAVMTLDNIAGFLNGSTLTGGETDGSFWGGSFGLMGHAQVLSAFDTSLPAEGLKMAAEAAAHVPVLWLLAVSFRRSGWLGGQNGK